MKPKFQPPNPAPNGSSTTKAAAEAQLDVVSTRPGADIEVDGKFGGNTPSSIGVAPGEHDVTIKKTGFAPWERKITVSAGHVNMVAELTTEPK